MNKNSKTNIFYDDFIPKKEKEIEREIQELFENKLIEPTLETIEKARFLIKSNNNIESKIDSLHPFNCSIYNDDITKIKIDLNVNESEQIWKTIYAFFKDRITYFEFTYSIINDENNKLSLLEKTKINHPIINITESNFKVFVSNYIGSNVYNFEMVKIITPFTQKLNKFIENFSTPVEMVINEKEIEIYDPVFYQGNEVLLAFETVGNIAELTLNNNKLSYFENNELFKILASK